MPRKMVFHGKGEGLDGAQLQSSGNEFPPKAKLGDILVLKSGRDGWLCIRRIYQTKKGGGNPQELSEMPGDLANTRVEVQKPNGELSTHLWTSLVGSPSDKKKTHYRLATDAEVVVLKEKFEEVPTEPTPAPVVEVPASEPEAIQEPEETPEPEVAPYPTFERSFGSQLESFFFDDPSGLSQGGEHIVPDLSTRLRKKFGKGKELTNASREEILSVLEDENQKRSSRGIAEITIPHALLNSSPEPEPEAALTPEPTVGLTKAETVPDLVTREPAPELSEEEKNQRTREVEEVKNLFFVDPFRAGTLYQYISYKPSDDKVVVKVHGPVPGGGYSYYETAIPFESFHADRTTFASVSVAEFEDVLAGRLEIVENDNNKVILRVPLIPSAEDPQAGLEGEPANEPAPTRERRLGLTPEQQGEREQLEVEVTLAREEYVKHQHDFEKKSSKLKSFFGLKHIENTDAGHLAAYKTALLDLQNFDSRALGNTLSGMSPEEQKASVESYLKRFSVEEWSKSWVAKEEERVASQNGFQKFTDWVSNSKAGKWYQKEGKVIGSIPIWFGGQRMNITTSQLKKAAIGVGALTVHGGAVALGGAATPVAAVGYLLFRLFTGTIAYQGTKELAAKGNQAAFDYVQTADSRKILKEIEKGGGITGDLQTRMNELAEKYAADTNQKLAEKKRQAIVAKSLAFVGIFAMPASRFLSDIAQIGIPGGGAILGAPDDKYAGTAVGSDAPAPQETGVAGGAAAPVAENTPAPEASASVPATEQGAGTGAPEQQEGAAATAGATTAAAEVQKIVFAKLEDTTVANSDRARGLWGILEKQLPADLSEAETNRQIMSMENLIRTKLVGLTDTQIQEQYGFSSNDINLIHTGENIKLSTLISEQEMKEIAEGKNWTFDPTREVPDPADVSATGDAAAAADGTGGEAAVDPLKAVDAADASTAVAAVVENVDAAASVAAKAVGATTDMAAPLRAPMADAAGSGRSIKLPPIDKMQGNYTPAMEANPRPFGAPRPQGFVRADLGDSVPDTEVAEYTVEQSSKRVLFAEYANTNVNILTLHENNMNGIRSELFDIDTTEFGPNFEPNGMTRTFLSREFNPRPVGAVLRLEGNSFESVYEDGRGPGYDQPTMVYPRGLDAPDVNARAFENDVIEGYTGRIADLANKARQQFGNAGTPLRQESLEVYLGRIGTLVTREKLRNSSFNFDF